MKSFTRLWYSWNITRTLIGIVPWVELSIWSFISTNWRVYLHHDTKTTWKKLPGWTGVSSVTPNVPRPSVPWLRLFCRFTRAGRPVQEAGSRKRADVLKLQVHVSVKAPRGQLLPTFESLNKALPWFWSSASATCSFHRGLDAKPSALPQRRCERAESPFHRKSFHSSK